MRGPNTLAVMAAMAIAGTGSQVEAQSTSRMATVDSAAVIGAVESFHRAISAGDSAAAVSLLDAGVIVLESGDMETRQAYLGHHLGADMAFAKAIPDQRKLQKITVEGSAAWVVSTTRTKGTFQGRQIDSEGAELIVLRKTEGKWLIAAIHWSSHRRRAE